MRTNRDHIQQAWYNHVQYNTFPLSSWLKYIPYTGAAGRAALMINPGHDAFMLILFAHGDGVPHKTPDMFLFSARSLSSSPMHGDLLPSLFALDYLHDA